MVKMNKNNITPENCEKSIISNFDYATKVIKNDNYKKYIIVFSFNKLFLVC